MHEPRLTTCLHPPSTEDGSRTTVDYHSVKSIIGCFLWRMIQMYSPS